MAQAFKGTLSASHVASAIRAGGTRAGIEGLTVLVGSDGGDGLIDALAPTGTTVDTTRVAGPLGTGVEARVLWLDERTAVVESREACGLSLLAATERDPRVTSSRGVGDLVSYAVTHGAEPVFVGLGGSATMDGGLGMARAWGWEPRGPEGRLLADGGGQLVLLSSLEGGSAPAANVVGLCDVRNPLAGPAGAVVYARQKGATPDAAAALDAGLARLASVTGRHDLAERPGAGAAGGLGFGILYFAGGTLVHGADWVLDRLAFDAAVTRADFLVVAEGAFDATSLEGKLTGEVIRRAAARGTPVLLLAPTAHSVPTGVVVEQGGGTWDSAELAVRAERGLRRLSRLLGS